VPVIAGANQDAVARNINRALSSQLRRDRYSVQLGENGNVLISDPRGRPNFSIELVDSGIENVRVAVQSVTPSAPPTVPEQSTPAQPPPGTTPGNSAPPREAPPVTEPGQTPAPENTPPTAPPPANSPAMPNPTPPPANSPPMPSPSPPPNGGAANAPASAPPPR
jgi:hypothetical protein